MSKPARTLLPAAVLLSAAALLPACAGGEDPVYPAVEGDWWVSEVGEVLDTCDRFDPDNPTNVPDAWAVSDVSADGVVLQGITELGDGTTVEWNAPLECVRQGNDFACTPFEETESGDQGMHSYTITSTWNTSGSFSSESTGEIVLAVELSCEDTNEGAFCADIEDSIDASFPCVIELTQAIEAE